jgi:hypothetical protein
MAPLLFWSPDLCDLSLADRKIARIRARPRHRLRLQRADDWGALVKALMFSGLWGNRPVAMSIVLAGIDIVVEAITATPSSRITHSDIISSQCRALAAPDLIGLGAIFALLLQRG